MYVYVWDNWFVCVCFSTSQAASHLDECVMPHCHAVHYINQLHIIPKQQQQQQYIQAEF